MRKLDVSVDPAPDLVIGIDITHSAVDRESIYASLGVSEMWTYSPATKLSGWINRDGVWDRSDYSKAFPKLRMTQLNDFVDRFRAGERELVILDDLRAWLATLSG